MCRPIYCKTAVGKIYVDITGAAKGKLPNMADALKMDCFNPQPAQFDIDVF